MSFQPTKCSAGWVSTPDTLKQPGNKNDVSATNSQHGDPRRTAPPIPGRVPGEVDHPECGPIICPIPPPHRRRRRPPVLRVHPRRRDRARPTPRRDRHQRIAAFQPLLNDIDLTSAVVTADALHTAAAEHARYLHDRGTHHVAHRQGKPVHTPRPARFPALAPDTVSALPRTWSRPYRTAHDRRLTPGWLPRLPAHQLPELPAAARAFLIEPGLQPVRRKRAQNANRAPVDESEGCG